MGSLWARLSSQQNTVQPQKEEVHADSSTMSDVVESLPLAPDVDVPASVEKDPPSEAKEEMPVNVAVETSHLSASVDPYQSEPSENTVEHVMQSGERLEEELVFLSGAQAGQAVEPSSASMNANTTTSLDAVSIPSADAATVEHSSMTMEVQEAANVPPNMEVDVEMEGQNPEAVQGGKDKVPWKEEEEEAFKLADPGKIHAVLEGADAAADDSKATKDTNKGEARLAAAVAKEQTQAHPEDEPRPKPQKVKNSASIQGACDLEHEKRGKDEKKRHHQSRSRERRGQHDHTSRSGAAGSSYDHQERDRPGDINRRRDHDRARHRARHGDSYRDGAAERRDYGRDRDRDPDQYHRDTRGHRDDRRRDDYRRDDRRDDRRWAQNDRSQSLSERRRSRSRDRRRDRRRDR